MAADKSGGKEPANIVHQQAILVETIHKEERHQKLFTNYSINPFRKSMLFLCFNSLVCW
jgi:FAM183A and FAM183B related